MEKAYLNLDQYKQHLAGGQVKFTALDVINEQISGKHDVVTFGFEVSLDILKKQQQCLNIGSTILVPLSEVDADGQLLSLEQEFCILRYSGVDQFDSVKKIMKTAFSQRIDKSRLKEESLDADYFNNSQRHTRLDNLEAKVKDLEIKFKTLSAGKDLKLAQLMEVPEIKVVLLELRAEKKRLEKLKLAIRDAATLADD